MYAPIATLRAVITVYRVEGFKQAVRSALYFWRTRNVRARCYLMVKP